MNLNKNVNFTTAKLLKEKEFEYQYQWNPSFDNLPTIAGVVMWLYEKHKLWIFADRTIRWFWTIQKSNDGYIHQEDLPASETFVYDGFDSPTEAYEAAIEYTLNNLI